MVAKVQLQDGPPGTTLSSVSSVADAGHTELVTCTVEATLPTRVSLKWVSYACRMAVLAKPRWIRAASKWTTTGTRDSGDVETISVACGSGPNSILITVEWLAPIGSSKETATARRLVTAFFTGMQWAERHRKLTQGIGYGVL